jgi:hypothetical protein
MHCRACDKLLTEYQSTIKNAITGQYMDLCKVCLDDVKPFVKLIDRKDLITEADLDDSDVDEETTEMDTRPSLEDFDDIIDTIKDYDEH